MDSSTLHPSATSGLKCRVFAVIIGIDKYVSPKIVNLKGCKNDAKAVKSFLCDRLHVPDSHVAVLYDQDAKRDAILSSIQNHLIENADIEQGDTMILFYAGHGSRVDAPVGWTSADGKIETICPHDEWAQDIDGKYIPGIPDRTINALLRRLAGRKGDNIIVIFDSCHSGGITRKKSLEEISLLPRSLANPCPIDSTLDESIWKEDFSRSAYRVIPAGFRYEAMSSHVLLAACETNEYASEIYSKEKEFRGFFSYELVNQLLQRGLHHTTYFNLINSLPSLSNQHPQCEGSNKHRFLFKRGVAEPRARGLHALRRKAAGNGKFEVDIGRIHGVVPGTEFSVQDPGEDFRVLGILVAEEIEVGTSTLIYQEGDSEFWIPENAKVQILDWGNPQFTLKVFLDPLSYPDHLISHDGEGINENQSSSQYFMLVDSSSFAHLSVSLIGDGEVRIERLESFITPHLNKAVDYTLNNGSIRLPSILNAISLFRYHLDRRQDNGPGALQTPRVLDAAVSSPVRMHLYRLDKNRFGFRIPAKDEGDLFKNNFALIKANEGTRYGIEISNHSHHDLFPYLFYFDSTDYSIDAWYLPPSRTMLPPLKKGQTITVGHGAGGGDPIALILGENNESEVGFLKLFVSTIYVDMDHVAQVSPLERNRRKFVKSVAPDICGSWVTILKIDYTITLIMSS